MAIAANRRYVSEEKALQIFAHERQRTFYRYFVSMQIMLYYAHQQFGPKLAANYHKITALKVVSHVKPRKSY